MTGNRERLERAPSEGREGNMLQTLVDGLLHGLAAGRVTLRQRDTGRYFGVTHEAVADGVRRLKGRPEPIAVERQPVVKMLEETHKMVVQNESHTASDDADFQQMLAIYGVTAQMVAPVVRDGKLIAIVSVHQTTGPRIWKDAEMRMLEDTCTRIGKVLKDD